MMNNFDDLAERKRVLLARSEQDRSEIALRYYRWQARSHVARQTLGIFRNPLVLAGLGLLALKMPWRRAYRMGGLAFKGWRLLRVVRRIWL